MELVLPPIGSLRLARGQGNPLKGQVLSLMKRPGDLKLAFLTAAESSAPLAQTGLYTPPRRFQAVSASAPVKVANRFLRVARKSETDNEDLTGAAMDAGEEFLPPGPYLRLPAHVMEAQAEVEAQVRLEVFEGRRSPVFPGISDKITRNGKERRGLPHPVQKRRTKRRDAMFDW